MNSKWSLFITGFIQVFFVSLNTYFIANEAYLGVLLAAFSVSIVWTFNVKRVAFGSTKDRIIYSVGATVGSLVAVFSSSYLISLIG